jgi:hypothetical protein
MNITLPTLDTEQQTALDQLATNYDTPQEWASVLFLGLIDEQVIRNAKARGAQLIDAALQLPKEKRLNFTEQTEALYNTIATAP